jgi:hypothetical protein
VPSVLEHRALADASRRSDNDRRQPDVRRCLRGVAAAAGRLAYGVAALRRLCPSVRRDTWLVVASGVGQTVWWTEYTRQDMGRYRFSLAKRDLT